MFDAPNDLPDTETFAPFVQDPAAIDSNDGIGGVPTATLIRACIYVLSRQCLQFISRIHVNGASYFEEKASRVRFNRANEPGWRISMLPQSL